MFHHLINYVFEYFEDQNLIGIFKRSIQPLSELMQDFDSDTKSLCVEAQDLGAHFLMIIPHIVQINAAWSPDFRNEGRSSCF